MCAKQLLTEPDAIEEVREALSSVLGKRWMLALWVVDEEQQDGKVNLHTRLVNRTTWRFPHESIEESLQSLGENLEEEKQTGEPPVPAPLDVAPFVRDKEEDRVSDEEMREMLKGPEEDRSRLDEFLAPNG